MRVRRIPKATKATDPIDLSLFCHIENDPFLAGTVDLEGNQFGRTIEYMARYCSQLDKSIPEFNLLHEKMATLQAVDNELIAATPFGVENPKGKLKQLSHRIAKDVLTLKPDEYYSLPGGWLSSSDGHAMVYQFKMTEDGLEFYIHNSGAGIQYHEKKSAKDRELYYPVLAYKIPKPVDETKLSDYVNGLLRAQVPSARDYNEQRFDEDKLYKEVISRIVFLDGEPKPVAHEAEHAFTASQQSGTCAQRVLHQLLKENFKDLHEYQQFIYGFKRHALDDYINVLKGDPRQLHDPRVHNLLKHAMDTMVRSLKIPGLFDDQKIKDELWAIQEYRELLRDNPPILEKPEALVLRAENTDTHFNLINLPLTNRLTTSPLNVRPKQGFIPERGLAGGKKLFEELEGLLNDCLLLNDMGCHVDIIKRLETMFTSLPIPNKDHGFYEPIPFYSAINQDNQKHFFDLLGSLQQSYRNACATLSSEAIVPKMLVVGLSATAVVDHISCQFPVDPKAGKELTMHLLLKQNIEQLFLTNKENPYLATNVAAMDKRLKDIERIYMATEEFNDVAELVVIYNQIINTEPVLKSALEYQYNAKKPPDPFAAGIEKARLQALYVLTTYTEELRSQPKFKPLIDKLDLQNAKEHCLLLAAKGIWGNFDQSPNSLELFFEVWGVSAKSILANFINTTLNPSFIEQKYTFRGSAPAKGALQIDVDGDRFYGIKDSPSRDSITQLYPPSMLATIGRKPPKDPKKIAAINAHLLDKEDILNRELFHLRASSDHQILLTLDYFSEHMAQLSSPSVQIYFEANLFQPGLLLNLLAKDPNAFMDKFGALINKGLKQFSENGLSSQASLFFIREAFLIYRYAAELKIPMGLETFKQFQDRLGGILGIDKDNKTAIKQTLYQYQFLTAMACYNLAPHEVMVDERLKQAFIPFLFTNAYANPLAFQDTAFRFDLECIKDDFKHLVAQSSPALINDLLGKALAELGLGECTRISKDEQGFYQVLMKRGETITPYQVDLERGLIFNQQGLAFTPIPLAISEHKALPFLDIKHLDPCFCSHDQRVFELAGGELRFIRDTPNSRFSVQKKWIVNGHEAWFELESLNKAQIAAFNLQTTAIPLEDLPKSLKQRDTAIWVAIEEPKKLLFTVNNQPAYLGVSSADQYTWTIQELDGRAKPTGYVLCKEAPWLEPIFQSFEGQEFVVVCEKSPNDFRIKLDRYGLTLLAHKEANGDTSVVIEGAEHLKLAQQMSETISGASGLVFEDIKTHKRCCYMPLQPFVNTGEPSANSEFFALMPDLKAQIPTKVVETLAQEKDPNDFLWQYRGIERFVTYEIGKDGAPIAENSADALYLAYVYLGVHQPEKAWVILDDCQKRLGGVKGNALELSMLELLVKQLPFCLGANDKKASPDTPAYVACKLKAMALFTSGYSPDKKIKIPEPTVDPKTPDGLYQEKRIKDLQAFYGTLNNNLAQLYSRFQNMERSLPHQFRLSDDEKKSLLDYYHFNLPDPPDGSSKALGALGYSWKMLGIRELGQELAAIDALEHTKGPLPAAYQKRRDEIRTILSDEGSTVRGTKTSSELELVPINLDIPAGLIDDSLRMDWMRYTFSQSSGDANGRATALSALNMDMTDSELAANFFTYYRMIIDGEDCKREKEVLLDFCRRYLMAMHQTPLEKQSSKVAYLCNILLRINENPSRIITTPLMSDLKEVETLHPPIISLYQLKDTTSSVLASASSMWAEIAPEVLEYHDQMIAAPSAVLADYSVEHLMDAPELGAAFITLAGEYREKAHLFGRAPEEAIVSGTGLEVLSAGEIAAGRVQYNALQEMTRLSTAMLEDKTVREHLKSRTQPFMTGLDKACEDLLQEALKLANKGPEDPQKQRPRELEIEGDVKAPLDKAHLLALFFKADRAAYLLETGLSAQDMEALHTKMSQYVALSVRSQALHRLDTQLEKTAITADSAECQRIAQELLTVDSVDYTNEAVLAFFQYNENLLLRPQQIDAIKRLVKAAKVDQFAFAGVIEKIIMGGGKSKVILPALAQTKATGSNLVVIEVPRSLLETNFTDLSATSSRLFGQKAVLFDFNINSDCSPQRLEFLYSQLTDVIVHKNYLVLAGDSVQSLELKYLKLLLEKPDDVKQLKIWASQVEWLDKIVGLFRTRADVVMDEVHQALLFKKKLNYTLGDKRPIPKEIIEGCVDLFKFFDDVSLKDVAGLPEEIQTSTLARVISDNQLLETEEQWQILINHLAHELLDNRNSPIRSIIEGKDAQCKAELLKYFANEGTAIPLFIQRASMKDQNLLGLYKEQLSQLLGQTLRRKLNENYGASRKDTDSGIAIPYVANNVPSEQSRFGNFLEAINFSIQMLMKDGLSEALLKRYLKERQTVARLELLKDASIKHIDDTPTAKIVNTYLAPGRPFSQLKLDDEQAFHDMFLALRHNKNMICEVLKTYVLPQIQVERKILHSDAYSHVAIYRSCQGITGTPWNSNTYHQSLTYKKQSAAASDGFILEVLRQKQTAISPFTYQSPDQMLAAMLGPRAESNGAPVRAIVDISATFKGVENLSVAEALANYFKIHQQKFAEIRFILFFNDKNLLCAMDARKEGHAIIEIGSTDPQVIDAKLGCGPEARFSYYDQAHTVGTDLKQAPTAKAMVLIDNETPLQSFLQGTMRMRGLQDEQSVEICVPPSLKELTFDQLVQHMANNEERQLKQEVFTAALGKMTNVIRADFMKRILALPSESVDEKNRYALLAETYFVDEASTDFAQVFGALTSMKPPEDIFNALRDKLIKDWSTILRECPSEKENMDTPKMEDVLNEIIQEALPKCATSYHAPVRKTEGTEIQLEKQMRIELQRQTQLQADKPILAPTPYKSERWQQAFKEEPFAEAPHLFQSLTALCQEGDIQGAPQFGEIYVDENYSREYQGQARALGEHLKPVHALLFRKRANGQLECLILSQREAKEIGERLSQEPKKDMWMTTTQHSKLAGCPPKGIQQDPNYQVLIEQVRFFSGELGLLRDSPQPLRWLMNDTEQKLTFFEQHLALSRAVEPSDVLLLRQTISQRFKAFQYIVQHPLDDLTAFDWKAVISEELSATDIDDVNNLAMAFAYANQHAEEKDFSRENLPQRFHLSLQAANFINNYEWLVKDLGADDVPPSIVPELPAMPLIEDEPAVNSEPFKAIGSEDARFASKKVADDPEVKRIHTSLQYMVEEEQQHPQRTSQEYDKAQEILLAADEMLAHPSKNNIEAATALAQNMEAAEQPSWLGRLCETLISLVTAVMAAVKRLFVSNPTTKFKQSLQKDDDVSDQEPGGPKFR